MVEEERREWIRKEMTYFLLFGYTDGGVAERKRKDCVSPEPTKLCPPKMEGNGGNGEIVWGWFQIKLIKCPRFL